MSTHTHENELIFEKLIKEGKFRPDHKDGHLIGNIEDRSQFSDFVKSVEKIYDTQYKYFKEDPDSDFDDAISEDLAGKINFELEKLMNAAYNSIRDKYDKYYNEIFHIAMKRAFKEEFKFFSKY